MTQPKSDWRVSAIFDSEDELTKAVDALLEADFARHDISVQADPNVMEKEIDDKYINPKKVSDLDKIPTRPLFRDDDLGWATAFIITIPCFIFIVLSLLLYWDKTSIASNYLTASVGLLIGLVIGGALAWLYRNHRKKVHSRQFDKGGKLVWVHCETQELVSKAKKILKQHSGKYLKSGKAS